MKAVDIGSGVWAFQPETHDEWFGKPDYDAMIRLGVKPETIEKLKHQAATIPYPDSTSEF